MGFASIIGQGYTWGRRGWNIKMVIGKKKEIRCPECNELFQRDYFKGKIKCINCGYIPSTLENFGVGNGN